MRDDIPCNITAGFTFSRAPWTVPTRVNAQASLAKEDVSRKPSSAKSDLLSMVFPSEQATGARKREEAAGNMIPTDFELRGRGDAFQNVEERGERARALVPDDEISSSSVRHWARRHISSVYR